MELMVLYSNLCDVIAFPFDLKMITKARAEETCMISGPCQLTSVEKAPVAFQSSTRTVCFYFGLRLDPNQSLVSFWYQYWWAMTVLTAYRIATDLVTFGPRRMQCARIMIRPKGKER